MPEYDAFRLDGRTALVVGASRGIGLAIGQAMARSGARTIMAARSLSDLEHHAVGLRSEGCDVTALHMDLTSADSIRQAVESAGDVDILVNVAGINKRKRFIDYTTEEYNQILQTNLHGLVDVTQRVGRRMLERGAGGKVIFIGSLMSVRGLPYLAPYAISKSGLAGLTRVLAAEWGRDNIQVNCIAPGVILTDLNREMWQDETMFQWLRGVQANPKTGRPEDVAALAVFLSSTGSDFITGQVISIDGGYTETAVWPFGPAS
jgi:gluconate 5-dehydrogenase